MNFFKPTMQGQTCFRMKDNKIRITRKLFFLAHKVFFSPQKIVNIELLAQADVSPTDQSAPPMAAGNQAGNEIVPEECPMEGSIQKGSVEKLFSEIGRRKI